MKSSSSFFAIVRFMYGWVAAAVGSSRTSAIERTISSLKITRPGVVRISSPCRRYSIVSWSQLARLERLLDLFLKANRFGRGSSFITSRQLTRSCTGE